MRYSFNALLLVSFNSVQSAEPQNEKKNNESGNHQSNKPNLNSSGEFSMIEIQTPKIGYTRSQLMNLDNASVSSGKPLKLNDNSAKLFESKLQSMRNSPAISTKPDEPAQNFNDDFWSKATASNQPKFPDMTPQDTFDFDYHTALAKAATDDRFGMFSASAKVDHWLNSGRNSSEYAQATGHAESIVQPNEKFDLNSNMSSTIKPDETSSMVSNQSAIRAKLLDKTAKVKQNLRKLTKNN